MKTSLLVAAFILGIVRSYAGTPVIGSANNGRAPANLLSADQIICESPAIGNFAIINLQSKPVFVRNSRTAITVKSLKINSINFKYRDHEGYNYELVFNKKIQRQDVNGRMYHRLAGSFLDVRGENFAIECTIK